MGDITIKGDGREERKSSFVVFFKEGFLCCDV